MLAFHLYVFFGKCLFLSSPHFFLRFLWCWVVCTPYSLGISHLLVTSFVNISSHSVGYLFVDYFLFLGVSVQSISRVQLFATPWIAACQASLFITISRSSLRLTSIKSVMPSSHLILGRSLLLLPPIPPNIRVFSNESTLHMRWPKYWSFSFSIIPSKNTQNWSPLEWTG